MNIRSVLLLATASSLALACGAHAQAQGTSQGADVSEVVVTGSRAVVDGTKAPTPVTVVTTETLQRSAPSNIPDALNKLPQFTGSTSNTAGGTFNTLSTPLGNYLNLRNLGSQRVLILIDGNRVPPTANTNAVDVNIVPNLLVKRVDIVTGGASAVYGSDAVSGVVNFILDDTFQGLKATAQTGVSAYNDAASYRLGAAYGGKFAGDRLHVIASYERYKNDGVKSLFDRDWAPYTGILAGGGTAANPIHVLPNSTRNTQSDSGVVLGGALLNYLTAQGLPNTGAQYGVTFNRDGTLRVFDKGAIDPLQTNTSVGGDGAVYAEPRNGGTSIAGTLKTDQVFSRFGYDLTDKVQIFGQGIYSRSETRFNAAPNQVVWGPSGANRQIVISASNPYVSQQARTLLTNAGESTFSVGRMFGDVPVVTNRTTNEFKSGQIGLKGEAGAWTWDANYVYGHATQKVRFNEFDTRKLFAAIDAVRDPATGAIVCGVTLRNPGLLPGCVPMNVLGDGNISPAAFAFARHDSEYTIKNELQYVNFNARGDLFTLPAGPVTLAVGGELREQKLAQTTNADPVFFNGPNGPALRAAYFAGIANVPSSALLSYSINVGSGAGEQKVKEAYAELVAPILKDAPFAQDLTVDLAGRYTHYKTSGSVPSWKVGVSWTPVEGVRIRANQSRDIAAPSLFNLYSAENITTSQLIDPVTKTTGIAFFSSSGNAALEPERADTTTLGVVLQPAGIPRLTLSVDAYRIKINGAIGTQGAQNEVNDCFNSNNTLPVCALIERPSPTAFPTKVRVVPQNLAKLVTRGVDFEVSYTFPLEQIVPFGGDLNLRAFAGYLGKYDTQATSLSPVLHRVGRTDDGNGAGIYIGLPRWKGMLTQNYTVDRWLLSLSERFTGKYTVGSPAQVFAVPVKAPNVTYVDANIEYTFGAARKVQAFFNVQNLFDKDPPNLNLALITNITPSTDKATYDVIGRYYTVGLRASF